jgi:cytochrome c55X
VDRGAAASARVDSARRAELLNMVRQDCGSCHGLTMKGGLGPPLLPESLSGKDRDGLAYTVLYGRPGTPMPPWKDFLTDAEARWIVDQLLRGLPDGR